MKKKKLSPLRGYLDMLCIFVITCIVFVGFRYFIRFPIVSGQSMEPTYHDGDRLAVFYTKNVKLNDIIVCWSENLDEYIVKRVIGVPGDVIRIKNGVLYRNDNRLYEFYINDTAWSSDLDLQVELMQDQYFLLGDNRNHSTDSRFLGAVSESDIFGKVLCIVKHQEEHHEQMVSEE